MTKQTMHFKKICLSCGAIFEQCKCMSCCKEVFYGTCRECEKNSRLPVKRTKETVEGLVRGFEKEFHFGGHLLAPALRVLLDKAILSERNRIIEGLEKMDTLYDGVSVEEVKELITKEQ